MTIHETVDTAMQTGALRHYRAQAAPVVDSLVQREQDLCQTAAEAAAEKWGVPVEQVLAFLDEQGYHVRADEPEPTSTPVANEASFQPGQEALIQDIIARLVRLEGIARQNRLM